MKILHVVAGLWEDTGGPAEVIPNLCVSLVKGGCDVTLLTVDGRHSASVLKCQDRGVNLIAYPSRFRIVRYTSGLESYLKNNLVDFDIVHNHGHWLHPNWACSKWAKHSNKPLVTTPHGTLVPGMLARASFKKFIAWNIFDSSLINYASVIHALSKVEALSMKPKIGDNYNKVSIIPNGVKFWHLPSNNVLFEKFPNLEGKKVLLFLSRVHKIKGIDDLVVTWRKLCLQHPDWHLLVVGPIDPSTYNLIKAIKNDKLLSKSITIIGPVYGDDRFPFYAIASAFVLPSYGEGLPTAILEALACGIPVVYTDECNFPEAAEIGAGLVRPAGSEHLARSLKVMLSLSNEERDSMGVKARELIKKGYTWDKVAKQWLEVYQALLPN